MKTVVVALALVALAASQATAQDLTTGNGHHAPCKSFAEKSKDGDPFMRGVCAGTINALKNSGPLYPEPSRFCPPKASTVTQAVKVVVAYMDKHPEELHQSFLILAHQAMREAWPC